MLQRIIGWARAYPDYKNLPAFADSEKGKGGLKESIVPLALAQLLTFASVSSALLIGSSSLQQAYGAPIQASTAIPALLKLSVIGFVLFYIISAIFYAVAKVLGGSGGLGSQTYMLSVFSLCNNIFAFPITLFSQLQPVGPYAQLIVGLVGIYGIYAQFLSVKAVHKLSSIRAAGVLVLTWIVLLVVTVAALGAVAKTLAGG